MRINEDYNSNLLTFTRASQACNNSGNTFDVNRMRYEQGVFGKSVTIEEGTTNLINQNGVYGSWTSQNIITSSNPSIQSPFSNIAVTQLTITGGSEFLYLPGCSTVSGSIYTLSWWSMQGSGAIPQFAVYDEVNLNFLVGSTVYAITPQWKQYSIMFTANSTLSRVYIDRYSSSPNNSYFYILNNPQLELKAYPTSFINGTRANEILTIPTYINDSVNMTNQLTLNQANGGEDGATDGFDGYYDTVITSDTSQYFAGSYSIKVDTTLSSANNHQHGLITSNSNINSGSSVVASAYVLMPSGQIFSISQRYNSGTSGSVNYTGTGAWQRTISSPYTLPGTGGVGINVLVPSGVTGVIWWVDNLQLEIVTSGSGGSYVPSITRRLIDANQGTIEFWMNVTPQSMRLNSNNRLYQISDISGNGASKGMLLYHSNGSTYNIEEDSDSGSQSSNGIADSYTPYGWHHFATKWSAAIPETKLLIDGIVRISANSIYMPSGFGQYMALGDTYPQVGNTMVDTQFDDLRISNIERTDTQIFNDYISGQPLPIDSYTTIKLNFDDAPQRKSKNIVIGGDN